MCQSKNNNLSNHKHNHSNQRITIMMYLIGLGLYITTSRLDKGLLSLISHLGVMILAGNHVVVEGIKDTYKETLAKKRFTPNVHVLMTLASFGSLFIEEYREGALLILIFAGAHFLEDYAEGKSSKEISNLLSLNPDNARLINEDGTISQVDTSNLKIGDKVSILNGDQIPVDGIVIEGMSTVNQASITGESIPVSVSKGSQVYGSSINGNGSLVVEVSKTSDDTVIAKIIKMVSQAQSNVSKTAAFIKKLEPLYVTIILLIAPLFYLFGIATMMWSHDVAFYRTMVFLIVASPCALAATDIPATLSSISNLARNGVLFKGGSYLSNLGDIKAVAFDKTGTITRGLPEVVSWNQIGNDLTDEDLNVLYSMEIQNNHPLANAIVIALGERKKVDVITDNLIGKGIVGYYNNSTYKIGNLATDENDSLRDSLETLQDSGQTVVVFSKNNEALVIIGIDDSAKESAYRSIRYFKNQGIETAIISGDSPKTVSALAIKMGIDKFYGGVMPEMKSKIVKELKNEYGVVTMLGDGVNDAPALVEADIGFAMGNGTDIAIDVADAVLVENDMDSLVYAHKIAKKLRKIVIQNLVFSMAVVVFLVIMNILGTMDMTLAVIVHEGSTFVVLMNGLRMLRQLDKPRSLKATV